MDATSGNPATTTTRRTVVAAAGATSLALALAACGGSGGGSDAGSAAPSAGGGQGSGGGHPLARTAEIPEGGGKVFADQKVVVTQPTAGEFKGFSAICTHQGCTVARIEKGTIDCPCHGSRFHITDGSVAHGPATRPLTAAKITVANGEVTLG